MVSEEKSGYPESPEGGGANPSEGSSSLSTRRARLRGSLGQTNTKDDIKALAEQDTHILAGADEQSQGVIPAMVPGKQAKPGISADFDPSGLIDILRNVEKSLSPMPSIDDSLNVCATNVAAVQGLAQEQLETLKELKETLANQTFYEVGIKLNGLSDAIAQAMEPTKALGDLIDVLDQMVATMQDREQRMSNEITSDQLVMNLADQLANGTIDSWTFKCAYMAVFPEDHPADLLRRLVELLGTQRLTEDLFRAAYEAVQAAGPTKRPNRAGGAGASRAGDHVLEELIAVENEEIASQLEALHAANEELQRAMHEREEEFEQLLQANQQEKDELKTRYEEFVERYEEVANQAEQREGEYQSLLTNKEMALTEKESEAAMLRHQIEELRSETEHMVKDMQSQLTEIKKVKQDTKSTSTSTPDSSRKTQSSSFFDTAPVPKPQSPFEPAVPVHEREKSQDQQPAAPAAAPAAPAQPQPAPAPAPQPQAQAPVQPAAPAQAPAPQPTAPASVPGAPTTGLTSGPGSYGSGVRAQVFEVIVRQALAGAHWREICAGPMQVNNISPEEVESEVKRRQALLNK